MKTGSAMQAPLSGHLPLILGSGVAGFSRGPRRVWGLGFRV